MEKIKLIVTLGPSTIREEDLRRMKDKGVDFVRVNMSHSELSVLEYFIKLSKKVSIPFILDTEGAQIRTGELRQGKIEFKEGEVVKICKDVLVGDNRGICLKPATVVGQLDEGDLIFVDFDTLVFRVSDASPIKNGYIYARVATGGTLQSNKSAVIVNGSGKKFDLPVLTPKDKKAIELGMKEGVRHIALSFIKGPKCIAVTKAATRGVMSIIAKIEARESLESLDEIIEDADALLVDRGDLSKEVPIEKIPLIQKAILARAHKKKKPVYVATNLLESMVLNKKPTRAEVNDVMNTILDGADGLILAAETAIGNHPMECINMMNKLIGHSHFAKDIDHIDYFKDFDVCSLTEPHGGKLVDRFIHTTPKDSAKMAKIRLMPEQEMDAEQIAVGTFSPLEGFMCKDDLRCCLDSMKLASGVIWPMPIVLDVSEKDAAKISIGDDVTLIDQTNEAMAILHIEDKYNLDKTEMAEKLYGTIDSKHPGVRAVMSMRPMLLGGKIDLLKRRKSEYSEYELTPRQVRRLFEDRGWAKVVAFHTRNVIHKAHEFIQLSAMERENCDGLFIHPVVGKKKPGDFNAKYIIKSYEKMMENVYPKNKVIFAILPIYSRYAGPREAVFAALCRKNFGCSHFIVGRDHTGVGNYYHPGASHQIFDNLPNLGIKPVKFTNIIYSEKLKTYLQQDDNDRNNGLKELHISGSEARGMLKSLIPPPDWFMRPEITTIILDALKNNEDVFVKEEE